MPRVEGMNPLLYKVMIDGFKTNFIINKNLTDNIAISNICKEYGFGNNPNSAFDKTTNEAGIPIFDLSKFKKKETKEEIPISKSDYDFIMGAIDKLYKVHNDMRKVDYKEIQKEIKNYLLERGNLTMKRTGICVDLGNNLVKVAIEDKIFSFVNKIEIENSYEYLGDNEWIRLNDDSYYYKISNIDSKFEKSASKKDKNFIPTLNYSVVRALIEANIEVPDEVTIDLAIMLPINQSSEKEAYINKIKENNENIVECRINGKEISTIVKINEVLPVLEGCASVFILEDKTGINSIIDVGSRTINICKIVNGKISKVDTIEELGAFNYYSSLVKKINDRDITIDNIADMIEAGLAEHDKDLLLKYTKQVLEESNKQVNFRTNNNVYFTGGTIKMIKNNGINFEKGNIKVMQECVYSNVKGALKILNIKCGDN